MNKEILTPESLEEEAELILKICDIVYPQKKDELKETLLREFNDPFDIFRYACSDPRCDDYSEIRLMALIKLVFLIGNRNTNEPLMHIKSHCKDAFDKKALLTDALSEFDFRDKEKLVVLFYTETDRIKAVYESESWETFACNVDNERLKRCIQQNSPCNLIMIHSHPESPVVASLDDVRFTQAIMEYATSLGSVLTEHFIIPCSGKVDDSVGILDQMDLYTEQRHYFDEL